MWAAGAADPSQASITGCNRGILSPRAAKQLSYLAEMGRWPDRWPNFIDEIVSASKSGESIGENNMSVLKLL